MCRGFEDAEARERGGDPQALLTAQERVGASTRVVMSCTTPTAMPASVPSAPNRGWPRMPMMTSRSSPAPAQAALEGIGLARRHGLAHHVRDARRLGLVDAPAGSPQVREGPGECPRIWPARRDRVMRPVSLSKRHSPRPAAIRASRFCSARTASSASMASTTRVVPRPTERRTRTSIGRPSARRQRCTPSARLGRSRRSDRGMPTRSPAP